MTAPSLTIALPSKGRIQEGCFEFFAAAGIPVSKGSDARGYTGALKNVPGVEVMFLSAGEIPGVLESGVAHLGITGEDLILERAANPDHTIASILPLGFARADVVVAVPQSWIDVRTMSDLEEVSVDFHNRHRRRLRVGTKYIALTRNFFEDHGVTDYRIVESLGATEGAPAAGSAELIVDITSTGATLAANNLKVLADGVILKSEAHLAASLTAKWSSAAKKAVATILEVVQASRRAAKQKLIRFWFDGDAAALATDFEKKFGCTVPKNARNSVGTYMELYCSDAKLSQVIAALRARGVAEEIAAISTDYIFAEANPLFDALMKRVR